MENNTKINTVENSEILRSLPLSASVRRHVKSMESLNSIVAALKSASLPVYAAWIDAKDILDASGAQYYYDFRMTDFAAVMAIVRGVK